MSVSACVCVCRIRPVCVESCPTYLWPIIDTDKLDCNLCGSDRLCARSLSTPAFTHTHTCTPVLSVHVSGRQKEQSPGSLEPTGAQRGGNKGWGGGEMLRILLVAGLWLFFSQILDFYLKKKNGFIFFFNRKSTYVFNFNNSASLKFDLYMDTVFTNSIFYFTKVNITENVIYFLFKQSVDVLLTSFICSRHVYLLQ